MAIFETARPAPFGAETIFRVVSFVDTAATALVEWNNKRVTRDALNKLSVRELKDIGLTRGDVDNIGSISHRYF